MSWFDTKPAGPLTKEEFERASASMFHASDRPVQWVMSPQHYKKAMSLSGEAQQRYIDAHGIRY